MDFSYTVLIPLIPLFVFLVVGIFSNYLNPKVAGAIGVLGLSTTTLLSLYTAYKYFFEVGKVNEVYQTIIGTKTTWIHFSEVLHIDMGVLLDPISIMMLVVVSSISLMVHIYSLGYMKGEIGFNRYYAFLSLFTFSMYSLVVATNIFQMYIFWELVGVSSFLLIGYYYDKPSAVAAAKKAFIVTRFADIGFLIGILILSFYAGTFDFQELNNPQGSLILNGVGSSFMGLSVIAWALILMFMGGAGKSAMFPLHIWLPDAMEGPTPVSALIHAATMVVAGVYLVARMFPLYYFIDGGFVLQIVAYVGAFTSLFAGVIACTQNDIKRVLAFSTMSQIGYMMLALGVSGFSGHEGLGYMAAMFHLFTHAMFKALLFLGAGSVIHAVHSNMMKDMGGLRKYMPISNITFLIAALAISGIPPFAGFFSKDEILVAALEKSPLLFAIEWAVAGVTAFYMFRIYFGIFWGKENSYAHTPHESPWVMTIPLMFLALMSIVAGFIPFSEFIAADRMPFEAHFNILVSTVSASVGVVGIVVAWIFYKSENNIPERVSKAFGAFYTWAFHKFYFDELYLFVTKKIIFNGVSASFAWFDKKVVDDGMIGIGNATLNTSEKIKKLQSGKFQDYATWFILGAIALTLYFLSKN
ncbi:MAG: NADH-quinone oxidoreductase subunit L [Flavobacteriales bacterium CG_4_9_14_0_2_um_filter_35_242]|nr:NADH-quinone oxidoreductase subunit L [Zetaproteobacteria bacterium]NDK17961.1 NADH-quinone oxidoreductase subunit L [Flavobacteriales bacterium]OIO12540.1 MAG: NADH-quinone oxidoreductase subunit L [Flavobacteriaceae bacterium CG1_02_35_72]PIR14851.1 MAG: NADH-quinone oxidoreductase subunit L [Flavobacteriales bacterium CG11_big_fil_rev_8_21_14_0_20_35_7]PIV18279.1 MAG: NADH-quinone oxidoreductase subunit L [Flavobacteriales bacterium CG03_land_8_20_14_0_80_35_15]PIX07532.1 MAG: NADH-quino